MSPPVGAAILVHACDIQVEQCMYVRALADNAHIIHTLSSLYVSSKQGDLHEHDVMREIRDSRACCSVCML